jgi:hypothetical protein
MMQDSQNDVASPRITGAEVISAALGFNLEPTHRSSSQEGKRDHIGSPSPSAPGEGVRGEGKPPQYDALIRIPYDRP